MTDLVFPYTLSNFAPSDDLYMLGANLFDPVTNIYAYPFYVLPFQIAAMHDNISWFLNYVKNAFDPVEWLDIWLEALEILTDYIL